jgi:hypothetical protein
MTIQAAACHVSIELKFHYNYILKPSTSVLLATFEVLNSCHCLLATTLNNIDIEHFIPISI